VVPGGRPGFAADVTRKTILRRLVMAGLAQGVSMRGATSCHIQVNGESVRSTELTDRIRTLMTPHIPADLDGAPAAWFELTAPDVRFATDGQWSVTWPEPRELAPGRQLVTLQLNAVHATQRISASLTLHTYQKTPQPVAPLTRGQTVVAQHLGWVWTDLAKADSDVITDGRALNGMMLARDVGPGQPLRQRDLEPRPMVRRGETVDLLVQRGSVSAVLRAECRQDGRQGQMVSVMNTLTKRPVLACVSAPGVVTLGR